MKKTYDGLGYEQLLALRIMRDKLDVEGTVIALEADCSWNELFSLGQKGFIEYGMSRISPNQIHPKITNVGLITLADAEKDGVV